MKSFRHRRLTEGNTNQRYALQFRDFKSDEEQPEVVAHQLRVMARNWQDSRAGKTPVTDALRGAVKLPPDFDERAALTEELQKKHGVQG